MASGDAPGILGMASAISTTRSPEPGNDLLDRGIDLTILDPQGDKGEAQAEGDYHCRQS
jgi:hypothetical protein